MNSLYASIQRLLMTEKASLLTDKNNDFVFKVPVTATKIQIRQAVEVVFGKKVLGVRTLQVAGKQRRSKRADAGVSPTWKKAFVRLKQGERIELA